MKIIRNAIVFLLISAVLFTAVGCSKDYSVSNFTVLNKELEEVEFYDLIGKPIVLNFWATWCYYCKVEMPAFDEACRENPDILFVMVNHTDGVNETVEKAYAYVIASGYSFPIYYDVNLEAADAYGVDAFPTTFFISADGEVVRSHEGAMDKDTLDGYIRLLKK